MEDRRTEYHHRVDVHIHFDHDPIVHQIHKQLQALNARMDQQMSEMASLTAAVANDTTVDQSAVTLLNGLKAQLDAAIAAGDPAALQALADQLGANATALSDAITANTPAAPAG